MNKIKQNVKIKKRGKMAKNKMYKPTNDVIFKLIFGKAGNEKITKSLIEEIIQKRFQK